MSAAPAFPKSSFLRRPVRRSAFGDGTFLRETRLAKPVPRVYISSLNYQGLNISGASARDRAAPATERVTR
ncbi:Uncharacterised protein [Bordetella pertussis]|nr:Uncharacterised protein [Bordetella pertussis]